jgi:hypothetical protein
LPSRLQNVRLSWRSSGGETERIPPIVLPWSDARRRQIRGVRWVDANSVLWRMAIILKANKVNLFVSSVLFVFWYHSPTFLDTPRINSTMQPVL